MLYDRVGSGKSIDAITSGPKGFVAITHAPTLDGKAMPARNNIAAVSVDGVSWTEGPIAPDGHYYSIASGAGRYFAAGGMASGGGPGRIIASVDGRAWTEVATASQVLKRVRHTDAGFIAVGIFGATVTSPDGSVWTESQAAPNMLWDATFGAGRFIAVGLTLSVGSTDGKKWSDLPCGPDLPCNTIVDPSGISHAILQLYTVDFGNGVFVTQGEAGLLRSPDGLKWSHVGGGHRQLGFADGRFIALDPMNPGAATPTSVRVSDSADGQTWRERTSATLEPTDDNCGNARCLLLPAALLIVPGRPSP